MICITLGRATAAELLAAHRQLVDEGARLVEWRLDLLTEPVDVARLVAQRPGPIIVTLRRPGDGGQYRGDEGHRLNMLRAATEAGAEFVDLEPDAAAEVKRSGSTQRIVSRHDFAGTPDDLDSLHAELAACDADIVKLATQAVTPHDNRRMLELIGRSRVPTVGLCMGELGTTSRLLAGRYGAPHTYAAEGDGEPLAAGQIDWRQMRDLYRYDDIRADTQVLGVMGDPIGHSLSPAIHNAAFRHLHLKKVYLPLRIPPDALHRFLKDDCTRLGVRGLSVTIPHKEAALEHVTQLDDSAQGLGAINTLVFSGGEVAGYNTDVQAALGALDGASGRTLTSGKALVLGAGGAAKAIAHGLARRGLNVVIASRTLQRSEQLAGELQAEAVAWDDRHAVPADVLVNCSPLGMYPNVDETPYNAEHQQPSRIVFDTVYNPPQTRLLREAAERGCRVVSGMEMFLGQAALQFRLFTGMDAPLDVMRQAADNALAGRPV